MRKTAERDAELEQRLLRCYDEAQKIVSDTAGEQTTWIVACALFGARYGVR